MATCLVPGGGRWLLYRGDFASIFWTLGPRARGGRAAGAGQRCARSLGNEETPEWIGPKSVAPGSRGREPQTLQESCLGPTWLGLWRTSPPGACSRSTNWGSDGSTDRQEKDPAPGSRFQRKPVLRRLLGVPSGPLPALLFGALPCKAASRKSTSLSWHSRPERPCPPSSRLLSETGCLVIWSGGVGGRAGTTDQKESPQALLGRAAYFSHRGCLARDTKESLWF
ncbi:uncharacterized protein [Notamacropus eugenii]|uniref:uncharacterized protein n=1 Tax=Notamacropus eugenii TaxID=9315 RepID=UPI003B67ED83